MDGIKTVEVPLRVVRVYAQCRKCGARLGEPIPLYRGLALGNDGTWKPWVLDTDTGEFKQWE